MVSMIWLEVVTTEKDVLVLVLVLVLLAVAVVGLSNKTVLLHLLKSCGVQCCWNGKSQW